MAGIVVVGVDESSTAAKAAAKAAELAAALQAELVAVNAFDRSDVPPVVEGGDLPPFTAHDGAESVAQRVLDVLRADYPTLKMTARGQLGRPADAIVDAAEEVGASIIVVGNKRVQGISRVLGSIATHVAQHAPCDVYIAHTVER